MKSNLLIVVISFFIGLYSVELFLETTNFVEKKKLEKVEHELNKKIKIAKINKIYFDKRSIKEVIKDYKKESINSSILIKPTKFVSSNGFKTKNGKLIYPLAGISKILTINCNENGNMSEYFSDRYGFANKDNVWDIKKIDILMLGDSFAHGACVDPDNNISHYLENFSKKNIINLGYGANGPLIELATYFEYGKRKKPEIILWFYYEGNDLNNLGNEIKSKELIKYLTTDHNQELINKQKIIDKYLLNYQNKSLKNLQNSKKKKINPIKVVKLGNIRTIIIQSPFIQNKKNCSYKNINNFFNIIKKIDSTAYEEDSKFYFVYLPTYYRFVTKNNFCKSEIINGLNNYKINYIDIHKELFDKIEDPLIYFPFKMFGHYTSSGYKEIAKIIVRKIQVD